MQTFKTSFVAVLMLLVLWGIWVAFTGTDTPLREDLEGLVGVDENAADVSGPGPLAPSPISPMTGTANASNSSDAFKKFASSPLPSFQSSGSTSNNAGLTPPASGTGFGPLPTTPSLGNEPSSANEIDIDKLEAPSLSVSTLPSSPSKPEELGTLSLPSLDGGNLQPDKDFGIAVPPTQLETTKLPNPSSGDAPSLGLLSREGEGSESGSTESSGGLLPASKLGKSYENAKQLAMDQIANGHLKEGLATLTVFYNAPELTSTQRADLYDLLDALAREVVFSRRNLIVPTHILAPGETLEQVAKQFKIPVEVLARINAFDVTATPPASTQLKVVPGPFHAEVDLTRNELTLFVSDLYAGRFPVTIGNEPTPKPGTYKVEEKQRDKNYYSSNGMQVLGTDPNNPYGGFWIDLGHEVCIHGSAAVDSAPAGAGCISLSPLDASDVFGMLGLGSQVTIRR